MKFAMSVCACILFLGGSSLALAQAKPDAPKIGWFESANLSYVFTSGNTETSTLGFTNNLQRLWERSAFTLDASAVRADSKAQKVLAVGTADNFNVEDGPRTTTSEIYDIHGKYSHKITDHFFWQAGAGWDRNVGAGIKNRYVASAGVGNIWIDRETMTWRTDYGLSFTHQTNYVDDPDFDESFAGLRVSSDFMAKLSASTTFTDAVVLDDSFKDTQNYRANMTNAVAVALNNRLALKVALQWLYNKKPALKEIPLNDPPTGTVQVETESLDTIFTTSLVVTF
jgi:putative salt-induced outer membrane protein YdiY